jgi:hypothetical protein
MSNQTTQFCNIVSRQLLALTADANGPMTTWANTYNGNVIVAIDTTHMWEIGSNMVDRPRAIFAFSDQVVRGSEAVADVCFRVWNEFECLVTRMKGQTVRPGTALTGPSGTPANPPQPGSDYGPFYDVVEAARDAILATEIIDEMVEMPVYYRGMARVPYDGSNKIYGYLLRFAIGTQLTVGSIIGTPSQIFANS